MNCLGDFVCDGQGLRIVRKYISILPENICRPYTNRYKSSP